MNTDQKDLKIIIDALQAAIEGETDERKLLSYRNVLKRLNSRPLAGAVSLEDGFRYDYDDATDLMEGSNFP